LEEQVRKHQEEMKQLKEEAETNSNTIKELKGQLKDKSSECELLRHKIGDELKHEDEKIALQKENQRLTEELDALKQQFSKTEAEMKQGVYETTLLKEELLSLREQLVGNTENKLSQQVIGSFCHL
jgi:predicted  nucleic acid-binding Zn-ribbon protein